MSTQADFNGFYVRPSNETNGAVNTYNFTMSTYTPILNGDQLSFIIPEQIAPPTSSAELNCTAISGVTLMSCEITGSHVNIVLEEVEENAPFFKWTFDNMRNPYSLERSDTFTEIKVVDKDGYDVALLDENTDA